MGTHKNARLTPHSRELLVERVLQQGWTVAKAAEAVGVSQRTAYNLLRRFREEGLDGLRDRSSRPRRSRGTAASTRRRIVRLRRMKLTCRRIAALVGRSRATVARIVRAAGLSRLRSLEPRPPVVRYERQQPGEMLHIDIKKLARLDGIGHRMSGSRRGQKRGLGYEFVHVCIDDASRMTYVEILPDERGGTAAGFVRRAVGWFAARGITTQRIMTDNGACYISGDFPDALRAAGVRHVRTQPYTPRTNGKAERLIQTLLREWAYRFPFTSSPQRAEVLTRYMHFYNHHRAHTALSGHPPISRITLNNVMRRDS